MTTVSAEEASKILGVTRQTLYAYVSRGLVAALPGADHRESRYSREVIHGMAKQRRRGRRPKEIAKAALDWGLPVLETKLTLIEYERPYYRGVDVLALSRVASLEETASLLWSFDTEQAFGTAPPSADTGFSDLLARSPGPAYKTDLMSRFAVTSQDEDTAEWQHDPSRQAAGCGALVRLLAASMLGGSPTADKIHEQCAKAWNLDAEGRDILRQALVLSADHELNASSFTARCIASTGASLRAAVIGGLAALSGGRHGGMTARVEVFWQGLEGRSDLRGSVASALSSGMEIPGFGHSLYPSGDPRAKAILERIGSRLPIALAIAEAVVDLTGRQASLDFALVALRRALSLPEGAAFGIFALGRSVGWMAQALEQRAEGALIRPRAVYVGIRPDDSSSSSGIDLHV